MRFSLSRDRRRRLRRLRPAATPVSLVCCMGQGGVDRISFFLLQCQRRWSYEFREFRPAWYLIGDLCHSFSPILELSSLRSPPPRPRRDCHRNRKHYYWDNRAIKSINRAGEGILASLESVGVSERAPLQGVLAFFVVSSSHINHHVGRVEL